MRKTILIGVKEDSQSRALEGEVDLTLFWDDFLDQWNCTATDADVSISIFEGGQTVSLRADVDLLYLRVPQTSTPEVTAVFVTLCSLIPDKIIGSSPWFTTPMNKASQLEHFGVLAPKTYITNQEKTIRDRDKDSIVKSISWVRSSVCSADSLALQENDGKALSGRLHTPVMLQQKVDGQEYKAHLLFYQNDCSIMNVAIENNRDERGIIDYRYNDSPTRYTESHAISEKVKKVASELYQKTGVRFIDIDYFMGDSGEVKILEWNDSPAPACFERDYRPGNLSYCRNLVRREVPVIIRSTEDATGRHLSRLCGNQVLDLKIENFPKEWQIENTDHDLTIIFGHKRFKPKRIYLRSTSDASNEFALLYESLEWGTVEVMGASRLNFVNGSKPLQAITSLAAPLRSVDGPVEIPNVTVVQRVLPTGFSTHTVITKSISGVRSVVVSPTELPGYEEGQPPDHLAQFQVRVEGSVVRVHVIAGKLLVAMVCHDFNAVDHRYADSRGNFSLHELPPGVAAYCREVAQFEENSLMGIDFILDSNGVYHCLEANPQPGWSWYEQQCQSSLGSLIREYVCS